VVIAAAAVAATFAAGCANAKDPGQGVVATVNGDPIKTTELREILGVPGGLFAVTEIPVDRKKEALDRLVQWRLMAQDARSRGFDNTEEYRKIVGQNEQMLVAKALLRGEVAAKLKVSEKDVQAEIAKLKASDNTLRDDAAAVRAVRTVTEGPVRKIRDDLIATAKKDAGAMIDRSEVDRIGKGKKVPDNAVLASVGGEKILYGEVKKELQGLRIPGGAHGVLDLTRNTVAIGQILDRDVTLRALAAYGKKQGIEGTDVYKLTRKEMERFVLVNLEAEKVVPKDLPVTDQEIESLYARHAGQFVRNGKKIPLAQAKEQLREYLQREKRREALEAFVAELKKKAKVTVDEGALSKV
jgi:hypothetical protein